MSRTRVYLVTAALVAAVLLVQAIFATALSTAYSSLFVSGPGIPAFPLVEFILNDGFRIVAFGVGVLVSLRFVAPVLGSDGWRRTIVRGLIATAMGALAVLVLAVVWAALSAIHISSYPFGYSLDPSFNAESFGNSALNIANSVFDPLLEWFPLVVLAAVLLKLWLAAHPESDAPTVPASRAETLVDH